MSQVNPSKIRTKKIMILKYGTEVVDEVKTITSVEMLRHELNLALDYYAKSNGFYLSVREIDTK